MFTIKKSLLFSFCLFLSLSVFAQTKISAGAGIGFAKLTSDLGKDGSFGLNYFVEGSYYFNNQLAVGVEGNFNAIGFKNDDADFDVSSYGAGLYLAKAEYFFMDKKFSPYVGLGLGLAKISTPEVSGIDETTGESTVLVPEESKINFAISPRLGLAIGGFGIEYTYNIAGKTPETEFFNTSTSGEKFNFYTVAVKYRYTFDY